MQMQKRFSQLLKAFDPHFGRGKGMHPGDHTYAVIIAGCLTHGLNAALRVDDGRNQLHLCDIF